MKSKPNKSDELSKKKRNSALEGKKKQNHKVIISRSVTNLQPIGTIK